MSSVFRYSYKSPLQSSMLLAGLFVLAMVFFPWTGFETNDDALMMHICAGSISGQGSAYLVYSHIFLGKILVWLYQTYPGFNFYPALLFTIHWAALSSILYYCFVSAQKQLLPYVVFLLFSAETLLMCNLQFTSTSIIAAFGGLFSAILAMRKKSVGLMAFSILLFITSLMLRWESFLLVSFMGFCVLLIEYARSRWTIFAIILLLFVLGAGWLRQIHKTAYANGVGTTLMSPATENEMRFIMDFPNTVSDSDLKRAGWSQNDYNLCKKWFWADPDFYKAENFYQLAEVIKFDFSFQRKITAILLFIKRNFGFFTAALLLFYNAIKSTNKIQLASWIAPLFIALIAMIFIERLLPRVMIPLVICTFLVLLTEHSHLKMSDRQKILGISGLLMLVQLYFAAIQQKENRRCFEDTFSVLSRYTDHLIVNKDSWMNLEGCPLWTDPRYYSKGNFLWSDVLTGYPVSNQVLQKRGIVNLMKSLWERPDMMVLADQVDDIVKYAAEHYHEEIGQTVVERDVTKGVHLFHLWRKNNW